jgi:hypothetical protein
MPVLIFLVVMLAFVGLAFILENVRPGRSEPDEDQGLRKSSDDVEPPQQRRSA